jgi:uncharacterized membrane protein YfcA
MIVTAVLIGLAAGVVGGMLGVGGGVLIVPALALFAGWGQLEAEATSLLAAVPIAVVGAWRQYRYGNVRVREGLVTGVLAVAGVAGGVLLANAVPADTLQAGFGVLMILVAGQLVHRALWKDRKSARARAAASDGGDAESRTSTGEG